VEKPQKKREVKKGRRGGGQDPCKIQGCITVWDMQNRIASYRRMQKEKKEGSIELCKVRPMKNGKKPTLRKEES